MAGLKYGANATNLAKSPRVSAKGSFGAVKMIRSASLTQSQAYNYIRDSGGRLTMFHINSHHRDHRLMTTYLYPSLHLYLAIRY